MPPLLSLRRPLGIALLLITVGAVALPTTLGAQTSSTFEPPEENDHTFVLDDAPYLDASCATNEESPLVYTINVNRFAGLVKHDHTLANAEALVRAGLLSKTATLTIVFYQEQFNPSPPFVPQRDRLLFNGVAVGDTGTGNPEFLQGQENHWRKNSFEIPIEMVRFPFPIGETGAPPLDEPNEVRIEIDTANVSAEQDAWCTEVDWVSLRFKAMSPVILIHGNSSNGDFFVRHGFTAELRRQGLLWDKSISLIPNATSVAKNASALDGLIPFIARNFGVDSVHLIAHSKGGLDARAYLADYQRNHDRDFKVLSYTSLSTPHDGSVLADIMVARENALKRQAQVRFQGYPEFIDEVAASVDFNAGYKNLTTSFAAGFNVDNIRRLPDVPDYNVVAADADTNFNGKIDDSPDEFAALRIESAELQAAYDDGWFGPERARTAVDTAYQTLRRTRGLAVSGSTETVNGQRVRVVTLTAFPAQPVLGNDTLVAIPSGLGMGGFISKTNPDQRLRFTSPNGRNHSSIADGGVAAMVVPWIIAVERTDGDLK